MNTSSINRKKLLFLLLTISLGENIVYSMDNKRGTKKIVSENLIETYSSNNITIDTHSKEVNKSEVFVFGKNNHYEKKTEFEEYGNKNQVKIESTNSMTQKYSDYIKKLIPSTENNEKKHDQILFILEKAATSWSEYDCQELITILVQIDEKKYDQILNFLQEIATDWFSGWRYDLIKILGGIDQKKHAQIFKALQKITKNWPPQKTCKAIQALGEIDDIEYEKISKNLNKFYDLSQYDIYQLITALGKIDERKYDQISKFLQGPCEDWSEENQYKLIKILGEIDEKKYDQISKFLQGPYEDWSEEDQYKLIKILGEIDQKKYDQISKFLQGPYKDWSEEDQCKLIKILGEIDEKKYDKILLSLCKIVNFSKKKETCELIKTLAEIDEKKYDKILDVLCYTVKNWEKNNICELIKSLERIDDVRKYSEILRISNKLIQFYRMTDFNFNYTRLFNTFGQYSIDQIPQIFRVFCNIQRKLEIELTFEEFFLAVKILGENEENMKDLGELFANKFPKNKSWKSLLYALSFHDVKNRKTLIELIHAEESRYNLLLVLAFIPQEEHKNILEFGEPNPTNNSEYLLEYFIFTLFSDAQDNKGLNEKLMNHWDKILRSSNISAVRTMIDFILKYYKELGLNQEEDNGLYPKAVMGRINLDNINDKKNPYYIFSELLKKRKKFDPKHLKMPEHVFNQQSFALDPAFFAKLSAEKNIDKSSIAKIDRNKFYELWKSVENTKNPNITTEKFNFLKKQIDEFNQTLIASQCKCIFHYIFTRPESEQEKLLLEVVKEVKNCDVGKEDGLLLYYNHFIPEKFKLKNMGNTDLSFLETFISQGMEKWLEQEDFFKMLLNYGKNTSIAQVVHYKNYLFNLVAAHVGISWQTTIDKSSYLALNLTQMETQNVVQKIYEYVTPKVIISYIQEEINKKLAEEDGKETLKNLKIIFHKIQEEERLSKQALTEEMIWDIAYNSKEDEEMMKNPIYKGIKEAGVVALLLKMGAVKNIDTSMIF